MKSYSLTKKKVTLDTPVVIPVSSPMEEVPSILWSYLSSLFRVSIIWACISFTLLAFRFTMLRFSSPWQPVRRSCLWIESNSKRLSRNDSTPKCRDVMSGVGKDLFRDRNRRNRYTEVWSLRRRDGKWVRVTRVMILTSSDITRSALCESVLGEPQMPPKTIEHVFI